MTDRDGIFAGDDPFEIARSWLEEAWKKEPSDANAAALATVDGDGMPNVRIILIKEIEDAAFVFYTNYGSAKSQELVQAGKAAINIHWKSMGRQIRVRGLIEKEEGKAADEYYASRPLLSRIGAWASKQSQPLSERSVLDARLERFAQSLGENPPRPEFWGGFRLVPLQIEFWSEGPNRLHNRFIWRRKSAESTWEINRLFP